MDKLFIKFLELFVLGYQVQSNYMFCDGWSNHDRLSLMKLCEIRNDFQKGLIRIDPLSCDEAAKLWIESPKPTSWRPIKRNIHKMNNVQLNEYDLYLRKFTEVINTKAYQEICDSECTLFERIVTQEVIVFGE